MTVGIALQWNQYKYRIRVFLADCNTKWFIAVNDLVVMLLDCEWIYDPCRIGAKALEPKQDPKAKSMRNENQVQQLTKEIRKRMRNNRISKSSKVAVYDVDAGVIELWTAA